MYPFFTTSVYVNFSPNGLIDGFVFSIPLLLESEQKEMFSALGEGGLYTDDCSEPEQYALTLALLNDLQRQFDERTAPPAALERMDAMIRLAKSISLE